jgi:hypothetical protein
MQCGRTKRLAKSNSLERKLDDFAIVIEKKSQRRFTS